MTKFDIEVSKKLEETISIARQDDDFDTSPNHIKDWMQHVENCLRDNEEIVRDVFQLQDYRGKLSYDKLAREAVKRGIIHLGKYCQLIREMVDRDYGTKAPTHSYLLVTVQSTLLKFLHLNDDSYLRYFYNHEPEMLILANQIMEPIRGINIESYVDKIEHPLKRAWSRRKK